MVVHRPSFGNPHQALLTLALLMVTLEGILALLPRPLKTSSAQTFGPEAVVALAPASDTYLDEGHPDTAFGVDNRLRMFRSEFLQEGYALLRFDLASLPGTATIDAGQLQLYLQPEAVPGASPATIVVSRVESDWTESAATWNTAPALDCCWGSADVYSDPNLGYWYSWDVSDLVRAWYAQPGGNHGLALRGPTSPAFARAFDSREAAQAPRLLISFTAPTATPKHTATPTASNTTKPSATATRTDTPGVSPSATSGPGTPSPTAPPGRSLQLDGSGARAEVPYSSDFNSLAAITLEAWVKREEVRCETVFGNGWMESYWLGICNSALRFYRGGAAAADGSRAVPTGAWTHIALTYDGTVRRFYVNGVLDNETTANNGPLVGAAAGQPLRVGDDRSTSTLGFHGLIDEARLWSVVRTPEQIAANQYATLDAPQDGLLAVWHFDGTADDAVGDHDGSLVGSAQYSPEGFPDAVPTATAGTSEPTTPSPGSTPTAATPTLSPTAAPDTPTPKPSPTITPTATPTAPPTAFPTLLPTSTAAPQTLGGRVWLDANRDGQIDPAEIGIPNVRLFVAADSVVLRGAVTAADGTFTFGDVAPGSYVVNVDDWSLPPGYTLVSGSDPAAITVPASGKVPDVNFGYAPVPSPTPTPTPSSSADLWIMAIEVNQGLQDYVFTDVTRAPGEPGWVPLSGSDFAAPLLPGKPAVVRVYIGARAGAGEPTVPTDGVVATGDLSVRRGDFGALPTTLQPVDNMGCSEPSGLTGGQRCLRQIRVRPPLGRLGLDTSTDYDLDLIDERSHWEGTLNYVLPAATIADAAGAGLVLDADVTPIGWRETAGGDNTFRLELGKIAPPSSLPLRLVNVHVGSRASTSAQIAAALANMPRLTWTDRFTGPRATTFYYDRSVMKIKVAGITVKTLDQCQTLWVDLYGAYGLNPDATLLAFTPNRIGLASCRGLGWRVLSYGGLSVSETPADPDDDDTYGVLAQEFFHAQYDKRHVSNDHREAAGCPLPDVVAEIVAALVGIDPDCWKVPMHPHGDIGEYPESDVVAGTGHLAGRIYGNRGAVGVKIRREPSNWRLTLYDPCPTGAVDRSAPLTTIGQRWDLTEGRFACTVSPDGSDTDLWVPHDFMSYGLTPWTSEPEFQGVTVPPSLDPVAAAEAHHPDQSGPSGSRLQVAAVLDANGVTGFGPVLPGAGFSPPHVTSGQSDSPVLLQIEGTEGQHLTVPVAVGLAPPHPESFLFFGAALPEGVAIHTMQLTFKDQVLAEQTASANAPDVGLRSPVAGDQWWLGQTRTVRWAATDADGDELTSFLELSADGGVTWQPLGTVAGRSELPVTADGLPTTSDAKLRLSVSDGINVTTVVSDGAFTIGDRLFVPSANGHRAQLR